MTKPRPRKIRKPRDIEIMDIKSFGHVYGFTIGVGLEVMTPSEAERLALWLKRAAIWLKQNKKEYRK